jgi:hypothetical protein
MKRVGITGRTVATGKLLQTVQSSMSSLAEVINEDDVLWLRRESRIHYPRAMFALISCRQKISVTLGLLRIGRLTWCHSFAVSAA